VRVLEHRLGADDGRDEFVSLLSARRRRVPLGGIPAAVQDTSGNARSLVREHGQGLGSAARAKGLEVFEHSWQVGDFIEIRGEEVVADQHLLAAEPGGEEAGGIQK
jgi:hypothetical protein